MKRKPMCFFTVTLLLTIAACAYPLYMGWLSLEAFTEEGFVRSENYPKYVIPYAPLALSLVISVSLVSFFNRLKNPRLMLGFLAFALFLGAEIPLERIPVRTPWLSETASASTMDSALKIEVGQWQYSRCSALTPSEFRMLLSPTKHEPAVDSSLLNRLTHSAADTSGQSIKDDWKVKQWQMYLCSSRTPAWNVSDTVRFSPSAANVPKTETQTSALREKMIPSELVQPFVPADELYKIHFYAIALLILFLSLNIIQCGFARLVKGEPLWNRAFAVQITILTLFVSLCIHANLTAFYRTGTLLVQPLSAVMMSLFFMVFGITVGLYVSTAFRAARILCALCASAAVFGLYLCEMYFLHGELYRFGSGLFFEPLWNIAFAPADGCVIWMSGLAGWFLCPPEHKTEAPC